jgi:hypothetical protein
VLLLTYFLIAFAGTSLIYLTNGLFVLVLIIALYFDIKIILKQEFFILPGSNLYLTKEKKEYYVSEIRSILVDIHRAAIFGFIQSIWVDVLLWNGEKHTLKIFSIGECSEVNDFSNNLQKLLNRQINVEFADDITLMT